MSIFISCLALLVLFWLLGVAADLVVKNIKRLTLILELKLFALGSLLGVITSLPELSVGIHAALNDVATISVGNLLGGIIFIFGFVLSIGLILNKKLDTDGKFRNVIPQSLVIFSPVILGLDGSYGFVDGIIMISSYVAIIFYISRKNLKWLDKADRKASKHYSTTRVICLSIIGLALILLLSSIVLMLTIDLLKQFNDSKLILGVIIFSIGTNLPEIMIIIVSWYKNIPELSLSNLIGSALANVLVLGVLATLKPINFDPDYSFRILGAFLGLILMLFTIFYLSDKKMERQEGLVLFGIYILFLIINFVIIKLQLIHSIP